MDRVGLPWYLPLSGLVRDPEPEEHPCSVFCLELADSARRHSSFNPDNNVEPSFFDFFRVLGESESELEDELLSLLFTIRVFLAPPVSGMECLSERR